MRKRARRIGIIDPPSIFSLLAAIDPCQSDIPLPIRLDPGIQSISGEGSPRPGLPALYCLPVGPKGLKRISLHLTLGGDASSSATFNTR
jgi:hypothetical protein